jgi:hypothetical protein
MEVLIGWDFKEGKQSFFGIFGEVFGWSDTTEEQQRKTLHSHILLFIALFDRLLTMLWSTSERGTLHSHILLFIVLFDRLITMIWSTSERGS